MFILSPNQPPTGNQPAEPTDLGLNQLSLDETPGILDQTDSLEVDDEFFEQQEGPDEVENDEDDGDGVGDEDDEDDEDDGPSPLSPGNVMNLPIDTCFQDKFEDELIEHAREGVRSDLADHKQKTTYVDNDDGLGVSPNIDNENQTRGDTYNNANENFRSQQHNFQEIPRFTYEYTDRDSLAVELEEWFVYDDNAIFADTKAAFEIRSESLKWTDVTDRRRKSFIKNLLDQLSRDATSLDNFEKPNNALYSLNYIIQGTYGETTCTAHQLTLIKDNCRLVWQVGGLPIVYHIMRQIITKFLPEDLSSLWTPPDVDNNETANDGSNSELGLALFQAATVLYFLIETLGNSETPQFRSDLNKLNPPILSYLVKSIARIRWTGLRWNIPVRQMILLSWKSMLTLFGDRAQIGQAKQFNRKRYHLDPIPDKDSITASPLDYHAFRDDITSRYPSYQPPLSALPVSFDNMTSISHFIQIPRPFNTQAANSALPAPTVHIATPVTTNPNLPMYIPGQKPKKSAFHTNQSFPFIHPTDDSVPRSIVEAAELFASRVSVSTPLTQLWNERDIFMQQERGWSSLDTLDIPEKRAEDYEEQSDVPMAKILESVEAFYQESLPHFNSFIIVILKVILASISFPVDNSGSSTGNGNINEIGHLRAKEITLKSASGLLDIMLRWLKISHIAKFEYISSLLFDSRYYLLVYKYFYSHDAVEMALQRTDMPAYGFFSVTGRLASDNINDDEYREDLNDFIDIEPYITPVEAHYNFEVQKNYSKRYFFSSINLVNVLRKILKKKTQRIIVVAELPSDTLRRSLSIYQKQIWSAVLNIFKEQVPFNGKKWKHNNMKLISAIYMNCKLKLRDDWLVGSSVTSEVDDAYAQEIALRALVQFYNCRRYKDEMAQIGYVINDINFFKQEIETLMAEAENI
ncbi:N1221-domain-containing protein [Nadsonia fulvescens var. elongata DSM 6958]|uniref:N1221-domain-containing protein n=1 Tax=Nadsonia fulvescens var. elongata DSM 6958 TaxID=857566 RepID=A0A1E3PNU1_9ASCO|nr:N1221-domain-containing protein [Nadsonia fulvescens var. elongata DSM 6958]